MTPYIWEQAQVRFGDQLTSWQDLYLASTRPDYSDTLKIYLEKIEDVATLPLVSSDISTQTLSSELQKLVLTINKQLADGRDRDIIIYVHGAKGSFLKSVALTAEIDHFSGRDFVGIAFSWPSHQNIASYVIGEDVERAEHSTSSLGILIEFLAEQTTVEHINIICYSAGGRLVSEAVSTMRADHSQLNGTELQSKFKLGTILFTAADVSVDEFTEQLSAISEMAKQVVVTVSDADDALYSASIVMGGDDRIGTYEAMQKEEVFVDENKITNFEIVDFSYGREERGFDITGHHYWYRHPWASSDILFLLRSDLEAKHRGLISSGVPGVWYLPVKYPEQVRDAYRKELQRPL